MNGIIYYTSNNAKPVLLEGVRKQILKSGLPITSATLEPLDFGDNYVYEATGTTMREKRGIMSYFNQIVLALENSRADNVFFCEHDILYPTSHFEFEPERDDTFYYNTNVWKWDYTGKKVVTYDQQASLSGMCANRKLALDFYKRRLKIIYDKEYDKIPTYGNPTWARKMGYEPGKNGGRNKLEPALSAEWRSKEPLIDIRHTRCMTVPKMDQEHFIKKPKNWREDVIENIPGWNKPWELVI